MSRKNYIYAFAQDSTHCVLCGVSLPAHDTWPGKRAHTCQNLSCVDDFDSLSINLERLAPGSVLVRPGSEHCCRPKCNRFVPPGIYNKRSKELCCSSDCWYRKSMNSTAEYICTCGCGTTFRGNRSRSRRRGRAFLNFDHRAQYLLNRKISQCGGLGSIALDYLHSFVENHYRATRGPRQTILHFLTWCATQGISSISEVRPGTITQYLTYCTQIGRKTPHYKVSTLSMFFAWAIAEERYPFGNPVVSRIHAQRRSQSAPRPLSDGELDLMWRLLEDKSDPRLLFSASIAEEAGLRISEICNLRLSDVDVAGQQVFVRLPNKSNKERYSLFEARTAQYLRQVLSARPANLNHDHILWNGVNGPMRVHSLRRSFRMTLCQTYQGRAMNQLGFDHWSFHRLRHNMASSMRRGGADAAAMMAIGGWQSMDAAAAYIEVTGEESKREYAVAMDKARKSRAASHAIESTPLTPLQLLERIANEEKANTAHK